MTPASWREAFVPATVHYGVPIANASAVTVAQLANRARDCGVKVLLTGEGADELFGGYTKLHAAALAAFLPWYDRVVHAAEPVVCADPMRALNPVNVLRKTRELVRVAVGPPPPRSGCRYRPPATTTTLQLPSRLSPMPTTRAVGAVSRPDSSASSITRCAGCSTEWTRT